MGMDDGRENLRDRALALIVAKPGPLRQGLRALVSSIPGIEVLGESGDSSSALETIGRSRPDLILVDANLPQGDAWRTLRQTKENWPQIRCVVLTDHGEQHGEARAANADAVLQKGIPAALLVQVIERLLPVRGPVVRDR